MKKFEKTLKYRIIYVKVNDRNSVYHDKRLKAIIKPFHGKYKHIKPYRLVFGKSTDEPPELANLQDLYNDKEITFTNQYMNSKKATKYRDYFDDSNLNNISVRSI